MDRPIVAIYDANLLYPAPLRDLFIRLAHAGLVRARWTESIHEEWIRNVLKNNTSLTTEQLARTRRLMNEAVRDCLVSGYEDLVEVLTLPDPDDRHVLAAAIRAEAEVIITFNLKDFPSNALSVWGIAAEHPDDFLMSLLETVPQEVFRVLREQRESLRKPPLSVERILSTLENQGLKQSVGFLRQFESLL